MDGRHTESCDRYPTVRITMAGHSAGGAFSLCAGVVAVEVVAAGNSCVLLPQTWCVHIPQRAALPHVRW